MVFIDTSILHHLLESGGIELRWKISLIIALTLLTTSVFAIVSCGHIEQVRAESLDVGSGYTYSTINSAIDNASAGDTIRIHGGTYNENLVIDKQLYLIGDGVDSTFINGSWQGSTIIVKADDTLIMRLNITGGASGLLDIPEYPIDHNPGKAGIQVDDVQRHAGIVIFADDCSIDECNVTTNNATGILVVNSDNCWITNSSIYDHEFRAGITVLDSTSTNIRDCYLWNYFDNGNCIRLKDSSGNEIKRCTMIHQTWNMPLSLHGATENMISDSWLTGHWGMGFFSGSNNNVMVRCTLEGVDDTAIDVFESHENVINDCSIQDCDGSAVIINNGNKNIFSFIDMDNIARYGFMCTGSSNVFYGNDLNTIQFEAINISGDVEIGQPEGFNKVYGNNFINIEKSPFAYDDGTNNTFDNGTIGNYWSEWTSPDTDSDGVVDQEYLTRGSASSKDRYPSTTKFTNLPPLGDAPEPNGKFMEISTDMKEYYPNVTVKITLNNTGSVMLSDTHPSFSILDKDNQTLYGPSIAPTYIINVSAGESRSIGSWDQKLNNGNQTPPGYYYVSITFDGISQKVGFLLTIAETTDGNITNQRTGIKYTLLQEAIDNSTDGDTIHIGEGEYVGNFVIDRRIALIGDDAGSTTLNGNGKGAVLTINDDECSIAGLTVKWSSPYMDGSGIYVSGDNVQIYDCHFEGGMHGVYIDGGNKAQIWDCEFKEGTGDALRIVSSNKCSVSNLSIKNYEQCGMQINRVRWSTFENIYAYGSNWCSIQLMSCNGLVFKDCIFEDATDCFDAYQSENITLDQCSFNSNHRSLMLHTVSDFNIVKCTFLDISGYAIETGRVGDGNSECKITQNMFRNCYVGVRLEGAADGILVHQNSFIADSGPQAIDNGTNNLWDNGTIGNYWSHHINTDLDSDGITDIAYNITGSSGAQDRYPLIDDPLKYLTNPFDGLENLNEPVILASISYDDEGNVNCSGKAPYVNITLKLEWYIDGVLVQTGLIFNTTLGPGTYNITFKASDGYGHSVEDTKTITIEGDASGGDIVGPDGDSQISFKTWVFVIGVIFIAVILAAVIILVVNRRRFVRTETDPAEKFSSDVTEDPLDEDPTIDLETGEIGENIPTDSEIELEDHGDDATAHILKIEDEAYELVIKGDETSEGILLKDLENKYEAGDISDDVYARIKIKLEDSVDKELNR